MVILCRRSYCGVSIRLLARAGNAHQRLLGQTVVDALHQFGYRLRLIACHLVGAVYLEIRQGNRPPSLLLACAVIENGEWRMENGE